MLIGRERRTERSIQRRQLNSEFLHQPLTPRLMLLWVIKFLFGIAQISAGSDTQTSVHVEQISLVSHVHGRERREERNIQRRELQEALKYGRQVLESGPLRAVHWSRHSWLGALVN